MGQDEEAEQLVSLIIMMMNIIRMHHSILLKNLWKVNRMELHFWL
jgi:hypothetical protein